MRNALTSSGGAPAEFLDEQTNRVYILVDVGNPVILPDEYVQAEVQKGIDAADRGDFSTAALDEIKAEGRRRLQQRSQEGQWHASDELH